MGEDAQQMLLALLEQLLAAAVERSDVGSGVCLAENRGRGEGLGDVVGREGKVAGELLCLQL